MANFLLVHGAWHGAWSWQRVAQRLEDLRHDTVVPCLSGMGERAHELSDEIDLSHHVQELVDLIRQQDQKPIVVAHSYSGVLLQMAYEEVSDLIAGCVFLDSVILENGERLLGLATPEVAEQRIREAKERGGVGTMAVPEASVFGLVDESDLAFAQTRFTPHPLATYLEPMQLRLPPEDLAPAAYIICTDPVFLPLATSRQRASAYGWAELSAAGGHDVMISDPNETVRALVRAASIVTTESSTESSTG